MSTKTKVEKSFDCVQFKRQAQERLRTEFMERKDQFSCYGDFVKAKVEEDEWAKNFWRSVRGSRGDRDGV